MSEVADFITNNWVVFRDAPAPFLVLAAVAGGLGYSFAKLLDRAEREGKEATIEHLKTQIDGLKLDRDDLAKKLAAAVQTQTEDLSKARGEAIAKLSAPTGKECPNCGVTMNVVKETADPHLGFGGLMSHQMVCNSCGRQTTRAFQPGKGYL
jgi:hypothetical protein